MYTLHILCHIRCALMYATILYYIERGVNSNSVIPRYSETSIYMYTPLPPITLILKYFIGRFHVFDI